MTAVMQVGAIGSDARATDLLRYAAPFEGLRLVAWSASPAGAAGVDELARAHGAAVGAEWRQVAADPALGGLIVFGGSDNVEATLVGLAAGKHVLCPGPCSRDRATLARLDAARAQGGGALLSGADLSHCLVGREAIVALASPGFGAVRSIYLAMRLPRREKGTVDVLDSLGWEAFRFVTDCVPGPVEHVHATGGALFGTGPAPDAVVVVARFAGDVVVTIELAQCLPASVPHDRWGEVEFEIVGAQEMLRGEPYATTLRHYRDGGSTARTWGDAPVIAMLDELSAAAAGTIPPERDLARHAQVLAMMEAVRLSLANSDRVAVDGASGPQF